MVIAISGSSGFIGKHLTDFFASQGATVVALRHAYFNNKTNDKLRNCLYGCNVVINLAGVPLNRRWTDAAKRSIRQSRIDTTRRLVSLINAMPSKPALFISASAVGIYPSDGIYSENSLEEGNNFLAEVCHDWEEEAQKLSPDVRLAITRFGVVLGADGGALPKMLLPFRLFVGGKIASGKQGFSWIHIDDLVQAMHFLVGHTELSGVFNFVSPQPIRNENFAQAAAQALHRPAWLPVPAFVLRLLYGQGDILLTEGQQAYPSHLLSAGYVFRYSDIRVALQSLVV